MSAFFFLNHSNPKRFNISPVQNCVNQFKQVPSRLPAAAIHEILFNICPKLFGLRGLKVFFFFFSVCQTCTRQAALDMTSSPETDLHKLLQAKLLKRRPI